MSLAPAAPAEALSSLDVERLLLPVLVQLLVIIAAARVFGAVARWFRQPAVVGEIFAGMLLGPSVFGRLCPEIFVAVFRPGLPGVEPALANAALAQILVVLAQLGLIFLMFLVGLELELGHVRASGRAVVLVALTGVAVPFALGVALTPFVMARLAPDAPVPQGTVLFVGVTLAVTAIPVLGRIMLELNITRTRLGAVTLAAAGVSDAIGWVLLASAAALVRTDFRPVEAVRLLALTAALVLVLWGVLRPALVRYFTASLRANRGRLSATAIAVLFVCLFLCAIATNLIGIFAVFGAFLFGALLSDQDELRALAAQKLHDVVNGFFVPVFFTYTGLRTDIGTLHGLTVWALCGAVVLAAVVGKVAGCGLGARLSGFTWKESAIIGAMMNARGLMALVTINMGYELGVVPRSLFCVLVVTTLATTLLTTPLLLCLRKGTEIEEPIARSGFLVRRS